MRKRERRQVEAEWEVTLDLEQLDETMTVLELQDVAARRKVYRRFLTTSQLTKEGWCFAMGITPERHSAYDTLSTRIPDSILNKAKQVSRRIKRVVTTLHKGGI